MVTSLRDRLDNLIENYNFFIQGDWKYQNERMYSITNQMS